MSAPVFIGDELSASAYRLAGMRVRVPVPGEVLEALQWACRHAPLVLISAECAQRLPEQILEPYLAQVSPPVVVVPDTRARVPLPDLSARLRGELGVLE
jgi:vacuolar-type H+-ATPase subunit F/Vma7